MINIALIGFGVVGSGVYDMVEKNAAKLKESCGCDINVKYILDIRDFSAHPAGEKFVKDINIIINDPEISIVVEAMGGSHPAYEFTMSCLQAKKSVITSNKEVVAKYGKDFLECANKNQVRYLYEASVGGGIPIIRPLHRCLSANQITEVYGILNGTTNYILTQMFDNQKSYDNALKEAQQKGYAEKDPRADVEGIDTCRKICIISDIVFGSFLDADKVHTEGISSITAEDVKYAESQDCSIKLLGYTKKREDGIITMVAPFMVKRDFILSNVDDVYNAITVCGNCVEDVTFCGRGAGKLPTASAMVGDIVEAVNHPDMKNREFGVENVTLCDYKTQPFCFYLKLCGKGADKFDSAKVVFEDQKSTILFTSPMTEYQLDQIVSDSNMTVERMIRCL